MARFRGVVLSLPAFAIAGGCQLVIGLDGGEPGTGGGSSTTSSSSGGASSSTTSSIPGGAGGTMTTSSSSSSTTSSVGGSGGSTTTSSSSSTTCDTTACGDPSECPDPMNECIDRTCVGGCCGTSFADATRAVAMQSQGDCKKVVCDGAGATQIVDDDLDPPAAMDACHTPICGSGVATQTPIAGACSFDGGKVCGDPSGANAGKCVECNTAAQCAAGMACVASHCVGTVLVIGAGAMGTIGGEFHPGGAWVTTSLGGRSADELTLARTTAGLAVGALRIPKTSSPDDEQVWFTTWTAQGSWKPFAAIDAMKIFARTGPSISAGNATAQLVFHGTDFKHYYLAYDGAAWSAAEAVGALSFGPTPAAIAARASDASIVYFDGSGAPASNKPNAQDRMAGAWQAKAQLDATTSFTSSPALVTMTAGAELMAVYTRSDGTMFSQTRAAGVWSAPLAIPGANTSSSARPALAALPGGDAIMAFRGNDTNLYYATYSAGAWTGATAFSTPGVSIVSAPAVAKGTVGATAEIAFVKASDKVAYHARLVAGAWTAPVAVGGANLSNVAIVSAP